jgi:hypothetical protein
VRDRFVSRPRLSADERRAMYDLFRRHFDGVPFDRFERDLDEKNWVLLLADRGGRLVGFSTLLYRSATIDAEPIRVAYSGDTIVDPSAWAEGALARAWIRALLDLHAPYASERLLWLLISSGYRTYRFLPVFFREFWPRFDAPTPLPVRSAIETLAWAQFGEAFDAASGVVRFAIPAVLRESLRGIPPSRRGDPHVTFFESANPGHECGDELVCLTEIATSNLTPAALRIVRSAQAVREAFP